MFNKQHNQQAELQTCSIVRKYKIRTKRFNVYNEIPKKSHGFRKIYSLLSFRMNRSSFPEIPKYGQQQGRKDLQSAAVLFKHFYILITK